MAIIDTQMKFSDQQAVTATAISTNVLDLRNAATPALVDEGINSGPDFWITIQTIAAATAAGAATVVFTLESDSTADLATAPVVHYTSTVIGKATLVAGFVVARILLPSDTYKRFLGIRYTVATGPLTAGTFTAFAGIDIQRNIIYPTGFAVS